MCRLNTNIQYSQNSQLRTWGANSEVPAWKKGREPQPRGVRNLAFETSKLGIELSAWKHGLIPTCECEVVPYSDPKKWEVTVWPTLH